MMSARRIEVRAGQMATTDERTFGGQTLVAPLRRVLVRAPDPPVFARWREFGWLAEPAPAIAAQQHEALCELLRGAGAEVLFARGEVAGDPDAVYVFDPLIVSNDGALLLRPGKERRRGEPAAIAEDLRALGVPIAFEMEEPATAEGGDTMWLDERTLLVGRSYRTNDAGIRALREALPGVEVLAFDLPRLRGPDVAYPPLMPIRLLELLAERGIAMVEVPEEEFGSMGPNVLALAPRVAVAVDGNPETRRRMESAGVDVSVFEGSEIAHKGEGGPTCLTRPLLRG
jgi:N-dimethylarginine dimethylaminohydrolase